MEQNNLKLAVLIDADNISYKYLRTLFDEIAQYGIAYVKRVYGDWSSPLLNPWKTEALQYSITPIQQFGYTTGKNSTDSAMIIDAMDILYANNVDGFCLVSSDSDFTRLASRLRESGKFVIGFGENKTPQPFRTACDKFICLDLIDKNGNNENEKKETQKHQDTSEVSAASHSDTGGIPVEIIELLKKIVSENSDEEDGWIILAKVGLLVNRYKSDFDYRVYGASSLSNLFKMLNEHFELQMRNTSDPNIKHPYVRCKQLNNNIN